MARRILITGAEGFIGRSLREFLKKHSPADSVFTLSRKAGSHKKSFSCDVCDKKEFRKIISSLKPGLIFHLAGGRKADEEYIFKANFETTRVLFEILDGISGYHPRVVIPGTAAEYGRMEPGVKAITEDTQPRPASWYGLIKYLQTELALMYAKKGCDVIVARMFNVVGKGVPVSLALGRFAAEIVKIEKGFKASVIETRDLGGGRDFLDISDACKAFFQIAQYGKSGEIYNICSGRRFVVRDLLKQLLKFSTVKNIVIREDRKNNQESYDVIGSNKKMKSAISWRPKVAMEKSLKEMLDGYRREAS